MSLDHSPGLLAARGVSFGYGPRGGHESVFTDVTLSLRPGEIVSIVGQSGVGKSSLLRVLAGLLQPQRGEVWLREKRLTKPAPEVAMAFQDARLLPWLTLEQNVAFGLDFKSQPRLSRGERTRRVAAAIARVGLLHARSLRPAQLSGGMAQRASFARYLARKPAVMLLDEPFGALDELTRADLQRLLLELARDDRTTIVLSTHDIDEALRLSDRVILLAGKPARVVRSWQLTQEVGTQSARADLTQLKGAIVSALAEPASGVPSSISSPAKEFPHVQLVR